MMLPWWRKMVSSLPVPYRGGGWELGTLGSKTMMHKLNSKTAKKWDHDNKAYIITAIIII
jgi:hypothetical protein